MKISLCLKRLEFSGLSLCSIDSEIPLFTNEKQCHEQIRKDGFSIIKITKGSDVKKEYFTSTKKALVDYEEKKVYFKWGTGLVDCVHEYVHIMQFKSDNEIALSNRRIINKKMQELLNEEVKKVEELERAKKEKELNQLSQQIQKYINKVKKFNLHTDGLDEIEAYLFILRNCNNLKCSKTDEQIALNNLYKRQQYLNDNLKKLVQTQVIKILNRKRKIAFEKASKTMNKDFDFNEVFEKFYKMPIWEIIRKITKSTNVLKIYRIQSDSNFNFSFLDKESIPMKVYKNLQVVPSKLSPLIGKKILVGSAYGKHFCTENRKSHIVLNKLASKLTLIHEYFHFLQAASIPSYCHFERLQKEIKDKFDRGIVDIETYEEKVLFYQAINDIAEFKVYKFLATKTNQLQKFEKLNTLENLKRYQIKLEGILPL